MCVKIFLSIKGFSIGRVDSASTSYECMQTVAARATTLNHLPCLVWDNAATFVTFRFSSQVQQRDSKQREQYHPETGAAKYNSAIINCVCWFLGFVCFSFCVMLKYIIKTITITTFGSLILVCISTFFIFNCKCKAEIKHGWWWYTCRNAPVQTECRFCRCFCVDKLQSCD